MLHRSLSIATLLLLLAMTDAHAATNAMHAGPDGDGGCPAPADVVVASPDGATTATDATASKDSAASRDATARDAGSVPLLRWRSFLPGMLK